jgi:hypothetical protein
MPGVVYCPATGRPAERSRQPALCHEPIAEHMGLNLHRLRSATFEPARVAGCGIGLARLAVLVSSTIGWTLVALVRFFLYCPGRV